MAALFLLVASASTSALPAAPDDSGISVETYHRAARVFDMNLRDKVVNASVRPNWIDGGGALWYERRGAAGNEFIVVDAVSGKKQLAVDTSRLVAAIQAAAAEPRLTPSQVHLASLEREGSAFRVAINLPTARISCLTDTYACTASTAAAAPDPDGLRSPDGATTLFRRGDDLWLRDVRTKGEKRLTRDGRSDFAYGKLPDNSLAAVPRLRNASPEPPAFVAWSPDSRFIFGVRVDESKVQPYPFVEQVPQDGSHRPKLYNIRLGLLGDKGEARQENFIIDVKTGQKTIVALPDEWQFANAALDWSGDGRFAYGVAETFGKKSLALVETNLNTGEARIILREDMPTYASYNAFLYNAPNIRILHGSNEAIWFSERDGWGHLYLYDLKSGKLKRRLTRGNWLVRDVIALDEARRQIYFTGGGRETGRDPYMDHLYRVSLDGGEPVLLTSENADHNILPEPVERHGAAAATRAGFSPDHSYFIDTFSTVSEPPVSVLRSSRNGRIIAELERADASAVYAAGWRPPERVPVKAAGGKTDIYAVVYLPPGHAPGNRYPVIDAFYGGPQMTNAPADFMNAVATNNPVARASLAQLGFIVITIDGRGTPGRSKAFTDVSYGSFIETGIADHIAAIRQLAERYGTFDMDRVGVYGHSFGGYTSARAILSRPDFYKVAVSSAGPHNFQSMYSGPIESWFGIPDYGGGERFRPQPSAVPAPYDRLDNGKLAANLRGRLMLVYGDMDENALPAATLQLAAALQAANKSFDLLYLPNRRHDYFRTDAYMMRRLWDYFVEHLMERRPPENYRFQIEPARPN
jgi:dipeptidyl aminopeptidase/acylaminoacyl peptidase